MPNLVEKFGAEVGFLWGGQKAPPRCITRTQIYRAGDRVNPGKILNKKCFYAKLIKQLNTLLDALLYLSFFLKENCNAKTS